MSSGALMMVVVTVLTAGSLAFILYSVTRTIQLERTDRPIWRDFGLGLVLMVLFFVSWIGHLIAQWQTFTDE